MNEDTQPPTGPERVDPWLASAQNRGAFLRRVTAGSGLLLFGGAFAASANASSATSAAEAGANGAAASSTLIFGVDSMTGNLEPGIFATYADWMGIEMTARGLTFCDYTSNTVKPALAKSWDVSADGTVYTFHLRQGLTFHDGNPVTASDFQRSWNRLIDSKDPSQAPGSFTAFSLLGVPVVKSFRAVDDATFEVTLTGRDESFPARCSTVAGVVLSSKALDQYGKDIGKHLVGCGPFKFSGYTQDQQAVFERFDGYYGGAPSLEKVIFQIIPEPTALATALQSGTVHASNFNQLSSLNGLKKTLPVKMGRPYQSIFCWLNASSKSLSDLRVRQAFNYAIDRNAVIKAGLNGWGVQPAYVGRGVGIGYSKSLEVYSTQDLAKARKLVQAAGAKGTTIHIISPNNRWWPAVGQIIQQNLKSIGLNAKIEYLDQAAFGVKEGNPKQHDVALDSFTATIPDPDDAMRSIFSSQGVFSKLITGEYVVKKPAAKLDALLIRGRQEKNKAKRTALYLEMERVAAEEIMVVSMLAYAPAPVAYAKTVTGLNIDALGCYHAFFEKVKLGA